MTDLGANLYGNPAAVTDLGSSLYGDDSGGSLLHAAVQPIKDIWPDIKDDYQSGANTVLAQPAPRDGNFLENEWENLKEGARTAAGLAQIAGSPITGTVKALAGHPLSGIAQSLGLSPEDAKNYVENPVDFAGGLAAPMGVSKVLPEIVGAAKSIPDMLTGLSEDDMATVIPKSTAPVYNPDAVHSAISGTYGAAKDNAGTYYNFMNQLAKGKDADASGIKAGLHSVISDIESTPFHEASTELPYLRAQAAKIGDEDTIPLSDVVDLKKSLNSNFNPKRFANGSDTPYQILGSSVDDSLKQAAKNYPEFGEAKTLADKNWLNTVKKPFEDNTVLQQFWKPEDYFAQKSVDNDMLEELPDPTKQRAATMLTKIKNPVQLNAVRRVLPDEHADALAQAKIQQITKGSGANRAQAAGKTLYNAFTGHLPSALRSAADIINPGYSDAETDLLTAAKQPAPRLSTKYVQPFQNLKNKVANPPPKLLTYQPTESPTDILAGRGFLGASKAATLTAEEQASIDAQRANETSLGIEPGVRKTQFKNAQTTYNEENPEGEFFNTMVANDVPVVEARKPGFTFTDPKRTAYEAERATHWEKELERMDKEAGGSNGYDYEENPYVGALGDAGFKKGGIVEKRKATLHAKNSEALKQKLKRDPKSTEIELASYVGPHGVKRLLDQKQDDMPAHKMFPDEVVAKNRAVFFKGKKPYSVAHIRAVL